MEEVSNIARGGIGAALALVAAIAFLWFRTRLGRVEKDETRRAALEDELRDANARYAAMLFAEGDPARIAAQARRVDRLRRKLGLTKENRP